MKSTITLYELETYLNSLLDPNKMEDGCPNGVQIANDQPIEHIATAVSASLEAIEKAATLNAQALIVHHGIFKKNDPYPITGTNFRKIKTLMENGIALLTYHLPLDAHRTLGNNWKAAYDLGLTDLQPFAEYCKAPIGVIGSLKPTPFKTFKEKVESYYNRPAQAVCVKDPVTRIAIVSGAGEKCIAEAQKEGADCLITGRVDEPVWDNAHEEGISFLGLGHYATEVIGVKALADHLEETYRIPCTFIKTKNPF